MEPFAWRAGLTLVLASASPQRHAILTQLGIAHVVRPTTADEDDAGEPYAVAAANARRKAMAGRQALGPEESPGAVVLGCDTVVALDGRIYGKPGDAAQAASYLDDLAGRTHEVLGAIALATPDGALRERTEVTSVTFAALDEDAIERYAATGEWQGRAGGYAIQGSGAAIVERIEGDYLNVVGLPVHSLRALVGGLVPPFGGDLHTH